LPLLHRDYECRSTLDLGDVGAWKYSRHPDTEVLCCAYAVDDGPVKLWVRGDPIPLEFIEAANNPEWLVSAFNDSFERLIEQHNLAPRVGWPIIPIERHRCSQAAALSLALPASLEKVAAALGLEHQKDKAGHNNMLIMSRPRKPRKGEDPKGIYWHEDPERFERLYAYCKQDTEAERAAHRRIGFLSDEEQAVWLLDQDINDRGLQIDGELAKAAIHITAAACGRIAAEFIGLTGLASINQTQKLKAWLAGRGCEVTDLQKGTLRRALTRKSIPPEARRVIELRLDSAHAAAGKFKTMLGWQNEGRIHGAFKYHGTHTGRWTSFGVQLQNLKRPLTEDIGAAIEAVSTGDYDRLLALYPQPMSVLGDVARAACCAAPGYRLIAADLSGIESRVLAWLSGQQSKLDQWARFDRTKNPEDEPYFILGKACGFPPEQARDKGKVADLAFGYQGGENAWRNFAPEDDPSSAAEIKQYQKAWKNAHPATVRFWEAIDVAAVKAVLRPGNAVKCGARIAFKCEGDFLRMKLPSGRKLAYPFPRLFTQPNGKCAVVYREEKKRQWVDCRFGHGAYGGVWSENVVSAVARDVFAAGMQRLEGAGYRIVIHVHDEVVAEVLLGVGSPEEFKRILLILPDWAAGLPVDAKVREGERFCKTKAKAPEPQDTPAQGIPVEPDPPVLEPPTPAGDGYSSGEEDWGRHTAEYVYRTEAGEPYLRITRTSAKQFPQAHWENGQWKWGAPKGPKIPYRLPELIAAPPEAEVWFCEGERDADSVAALGLVATTYSEGAKARWPGEITKWFVGKKTVYILEDNDKDGRSHASKVAEALKGAVSEIRIVSFPELPEHGDVSDWLEQGYGKADLLARAKAGLVPNNRSYTMTYASNVVSHAMHWLWEGHLPADALEILAGLPGTGKSQIQCQYVASVTTGRSWPDETPGPEPQNVIMLTAEDTLESMLVPRLIAAGADLTRVIILKSVRRDGKDQMFLLSEDLEILERAIIDTGDVGFVCIDPITAYMGGKIDSHRATDVRSQLGPVKDLAERLRVGFSAVTHPPKNAGPRALDHFMGSQAFIAVARVGHLCVEEIEQNEYGQRQPTGRFLFTNPKNNPQEKKPTLAYRIASAIGGTDSITGIDIQTSGIVWEEVVSVTADEAIAANSAKKDVYGARVFLMDMLSNGPAPARTIEERAQARGLSRDQLKRAKQKMGIEAFKEKAEDGRWFWALPQHMAA
jgi:DNA polymerase